MTAPITFRGSSAELRAVLEKLPRLLSGRERDNSGIVHGLQLRLGLVLLSKIQTAFIAKSRGGSGDDGITWKPLSPLTIAGRRQGKEDKRALKQRTAELTPAQKRALKRDENKRFADLIVRGLDPQRAKSLARAQAFNAARGKGQAIPTRVAVLGGRQVDILRDTGELLRSLTPGVPGSVQDQVFRVEPGQVIVGTNKKPWHHRGGKNLLARPYWPADGELPAAWWQALYDALRKGIADAVVQVSRRRGRW